MRGLSAWDGMHGTEFSGSGSHGVVSHSDTNRSDRVSHWTQSYIVNRHFTLTCSFSIFHISSIRTISLSKGSFIPQVQLALKPSLWTVFVDIFVHSCAPNNTENEPQRPKMANFYEEMSPAWFWACFLFPKSKMHAKALTR